MPREIGGCVLLALLVACGTAETPVSDEAPKPAPYMPITPPEIPDTPPAAQFFGVLERKLEGAGCSYGMRGGRRTFFMSTSKGAEGWANLDGKDHKLTLTKGRAEDVRIERGAQWDEVYEGEGYRVDLAITVERSCEGQQDCEFVEHKATLTAVRPDGQIQNRQGVGGCGS